VVDPRFPYCVCKRNPQFISAYSVANPIITRPNNTYCFTIRVNQTGCRSNDSCCFVDFKKFEVRLFPGLVFFIFIT
jgi:hypothetical protein